MNSGNKLIPGGTGPNSLMIAGGGVGPLSSLDPASLETMDIDPSVCYLGMFKLKQSDIDFIVRFLIYGTFWEFGSFVLIKLLLFFLQTSAPRTPSSAMRRPSPTSPTCASATLTTSTMRR